MYWLDIKNEFIQLKWNIKHEFREKAYFLNCCGNPSGKVSDGKMKDKL